MVQVHRPDDHGHGAQEPIAITFVDKGQPDRQTAGGLDDDPRGTVSPEKLWDTPTPWPGASKGKDDFVVAWTNIYNNKTRVFATTLGHNNETVADGRYLDLVTNGLLWASGHLTAEGKPAPGYEVKK